MNQIDKIYTAFPYYGAPKITAQLDREGLKFNHKRIERLMKVMDISAIYPKPNTSKSNPKHPVYPYLLKNLRIVNPNQVWSTDITYVRADNSWFYLTALIDWFSRYVLSWELSRNLESNFCIQNLEKALKTNHAPEIHNSDQGSQFTSSRYTDILKGSDIRISMDHQGRCFDNIFVERLWRTVKYEEIYLKDYQSYGEAEQSLKNYFQIYNYRRLHQSLNYKTPAEVYFQRSN